jgi:O-Antigen ligase
MVMNRDRAWALSIALFTGLILVAGGTSLPAPFAFLVITYSSLFLLALGFWRLHHTHLHRLEVYACCILIAGIGLMLAQLIPLPYGVWTLLGGRDFVVQELQAAGWTEAWLPLSLSPSVTRQDFLALLPGVAAFVAVMGTPREYWPVVIYSLVGMAALSVLFGLAQKFQGTQGLFNFYDHHGAAISSGFFANPNFYAAQLYSCIPLIMAIALGHFERGLASPVIVFTTVAVLLLLMLAGLGATNSRAGVLLACASVFLSIILAIGKLNLRKAGGALVFILGCVSFVIFGMASLLRLAATDPVSDYRTAISTVGVQTLRGFSPFGSGFGSFVPAYQIFETPATMQASYVNHAHNDWLELIIEGGLPMALLLCIFIVWFGFATVSVWKNKSHLSAKAASISAGTLLLHSLVDYPLRTPAMMVMFAIFCGFMARASGVPRRKNVRPTVLSQNLPHVAAFQPRSRGFARAHRLVS